MNIADFLPKPGAKSILNPYERNARFYPALLLIVPLVVSGVGYFSEMLTAVQQGIAIFLGCGGAFLLTELARDCGKQKEPLLFNMWGGQPSVAIFRHSNVQVDSITKSRYHELMEKMVVGTKAPTSAEEERDPRQADQIYIAWSNHLRLNTKDTKKFSLLFAENISYGFRRNVWGLRLLGIVICFVSIAISILGLYLSASSELVEQANFASGIVALVFLLLWFFRFTPSWVKIAADAYAMRLIESIDEITGSNKSTQRKPRSTKKSSSTPKS